MALSGNKGEWSEVYTFLKLLADGKLDGADENLNKLEGIFYPLIKIIREEAGQDLYEYRINGNIKIYNGNDNSLVLEIPKSDFIENAITLFRKIKHSEGRSFSVSETEDFLRRIKVQSLTENRTGKSDIKLVVHDLRTGHNPKLGFSIKSMIGQKSTLFNPGDTTNFIFKIISNNFSDNDMNEINLIEESPKIQKRIERIRTKGGDIEFSMISSESFMLNLKLIDSLLPKILAQMLLYKYEFGINNTNELIEKIKTDNPLEFNLQEGHPFYEYKIRNLLTDIALGMTPSHVWKGEYDATGGIIFVKDDGNLLCYHIYNRNEFQDYLIKNTKFEQASTSRYNFGKIYKENNNYYIKLNLQIRFTN